MIRYLLRRFVFAVITLLLLSIVVFGMVKYAPSDAQLMMEEGVVNGIDRSSYRQRITQATTQAAALHLDQPVFYFSLTTADRPDTLDRIFPFTRRERLIRLLDQSGNWPAVQRYEAALLAAEDAAWRDTLASAGTLRGLLRDVREASQLAALDDLVEKTRSLNPQSSTREAVETLAQATHNLRTDLHTENRWRPALYWYGTHNQYHRWLSAFLRGDFGESVALRRPVWQALRFPLYTTLVVNGLAFFLAFRIAIPLGIAMARRKGRFDRVSRWLLLLFNAMPTFWLGGLLLLLFATPHTGFYLIKGINLREYDPSDGAFLLWVARNAPKFILPVLTLMLHTLAVITLQMRSGIRDVMMQDYIRTARAKGVNEKDVYRRHAFRNSLIPLIALFAAIFPALFAGSIVTEYLFNFPGMGLKTFDAYQHEDYPLLFAILLLVSVMTVVGNFLGDLLYAWADPRVRFEKQ